MRFIGVPKLVRRMLPSAIWRIPNKDKVLYLTFDDGPTTRTHEILRLLEEYNAHATFFCVGQNAEKHPELVAQIRQSKHSIGNHSHSHLKGWKTKANVYLEDVEKANALLKTTLFRPPYGKMTWKQYRALKQDYHIIMWTHLSYDFDAEMPEEKFYKRLFSQYQSGDIVVLHDNLKYFDKSLKMLKEILEWTKKQGVECLAVVHSVA
jgi:peptidoglycan/xylan/chitin deacetylase (PgdA/CDA1 family)